MKKTILKYQMQNVNMEYGLIAYSDETGRLIRRKAATYSDDSGQGAGAKRRWVKHYTMQWAT